MYVCVSDPVRAERYEDGILHAREKMQKIQDEKASEHQQKMEEVQCALWCVSVDMSVHPVSYSLKMTFTLPSMTTCWVCCAESSS